MGMTNSTYTCTRQQKVKSTEEEIEPERDSQYDYVSQLNTLYQRKLSTLPPEKRTPSAIEYMSESNEEGMCLSRMKKVCV